jgi:SAM-dependent methyltransferase
MSVSTAHSDDVGAMLAVSCESRAEYDSLRSLPVFRHQRAILDQLMVGSAEDEVVSIDGFCFPCDQPSSFRVNRRPVFGAETSAPNWREGLHCTRCGMNNRIRSMSWITERVVRGRDRPRIYITERRTAFYEWLATRYGDGVIGSEYLGPSVEPGGVVDGIRHEDLEGLSFGDARFDVVVCMDVLEHVNDPARAMEQIARVLKPGGELLLSVPFFAGSPGNVRRSQILDGEIVHHEPPAYHGASPPAHGWLVFWDFGWELVEELRAAFGSAEVVVYLSRQYVHLGPQLLFFRCVWRR